MHVVKGHTGALRCGYQVAARLTSWQLTPAAFNTFSVSADISVESDYWLAQRPIDVELDCGTKTWKWTRVAPVVTGSRVSFRVEGRPQ